MECATPDSFGLRSPAAAVLPGGTTLVVVYPGLPTTTVTRQHGATNWTFQTNPLYSVATTDGTSWTAPFQISNSQAVGGVALAPDGAGTMYCAFADSNLHTCYTATSDGQIWNQVGAIPGSGSIVPPGVAVTKNGELVCVHEGTDGKLWATTTPVAGS